MRTRLLALASPLLLFGLLQASPGIAATVTEFYHPTFDHYFITASPDEAANLTAGNLPPWVPTGKTFTVWSGTGTNITHVWRFFSATFAPKSGHFYTNNQAEATGLQNGNVWTLEDPNAFYMMASPSGTCPSGTIPLYRLYNNGQGGAPNHRYTIDPLVRSSMIAAHWIPEGNGADGVFACVPGDDSRALTLQLAGSWRLYTADQQALLATYVLISSPITQGVNGWYIKGSNSSPYPTFPAILQGTAVQAGYNTTTSQYYIIDFSAENGFVWEFIFDSLISHTINGCRYRYIAGSANKGACVSFTGF